MFTADGIEIRPTVRVLLLDLDDNALLFCGVNDDGIRFWFTPGGGADPGESPESTAHRELREETGLSNVILETEIWRRTRRGVFEGRLREFQERWFLARVPRFEPNSSGFNELERNTIVEHRWWSLEELFECKDRLVPIDLPHRLTALFRDGPPTTPQDISVLR